MLNKAISKIFFDNISDSDKTWIENTSTVYGKSGYSGLIDDISKEVHRNKNLATSILRRLANKPKVVLDVGAGYGGLAINFSFLGIETIAIEPFSPNRVLFNFFIKSNFKKLGKIKVINSYSEKIPLKDKTADLVILSEVLEHVSNISKTFKEVSRVLKPGGHVYITCPNYKFPIEQHYNLIYWPLMSKKIFSLWAYFLFFKLNIRGRDVKNRDFSKIINSIYDLNYITDSLIKSLCAENGLSICWSNVNEDRDVFFQLRHHKARVNGFFGKLIVVLSLPIKIARTVLALLGFLPKDLQYLVCKK